MKKKKIVAFMITAIMAITAMTGCGTAKESKGGFDSASEISILSREEGSGTRGAFVELFGIEQKNEAGEKVDYTTEEASITKSTSVMMSSVAGNEYAIGYVSLGSLNDTVKALKVDGAEATEENIKAGTYKVCRPFNIATKGDVSPVAQDFIDFILSTEGQAVISENGYISLDGASSYQGNKPTGEVIVAGSSSITSVMQKLKEAYKKVNPGAEVKIQESDSSTGMRDTISGSCDIGMASRELKDSELAEGLKPTVIATDGIAVIVNHANTIEDISSEQVRAVYMGEVFTWDEVIK